MPQKRHKRPRARLPLSKNGLRALATAGVIAGGTQAYAEPIRFDNPNNQWDWESGGMYDPALPEQFLDITLDPSAQGSTYLGAHTNFRHVDYGYNNSTAIYSYARLLSVDNYWGDFALGLDAGTMIGEAGQAFSQSIPWVMFEYYTSYSYIPEGVQTYLGAKIEINDQDHYGWIGITRNGGSLDAFAWGYETDPGVPIAAGVPEPTSLALLALGFCAAAARRR